MRLKRLFLLLLLLVPLNVQAAVEQPLLKDKPDQLNYSLGYHLGEQLSKSELRFNPDLLWQALNDGIAGLEPQQAAEDYTMSFELGQEIVHHQIEFRAPALWQGLYDMIDQTYPRVEEREMNKLLVELRGLPDIPVEKKVVSSSAANAEATAKPPKTFRLPGQKFLAENKEKTGVITLPSGLQYRVIESGNGTRSPAGEDQVLINYEGKTTDDQGFSGAGMLSNTFVVNKLMPGLAQALRMMHEGDRWEVFIPTRLAFKDVGPMAGRTVIYELHLVEILPKPEP